MKKKFHIGQLVFDLVDRYEWVIVDSEFWPRYGDKEPVYYVQPPGGKRTDGFARHYYESQLILKGTMKLPQFKFNGTDNAQVTLFGNPKNPEPGTVTIAFPGGEVEVTRTTNDEYWVHMITHSHRDERESKENDRPLKAGKFIEARLDAVGCSVGCLENLGDFAHPKLNHVALRVGLAGPDPDPPPTTPPQLVKKKRKPKAQKAKAKK